MLIFAPHPDDEVLGVGGTIAKRASQGWKIVDCIVTSDENQPNSIYIYIYKENCNAEGQF